MPHSLRVSSTLLLVVLATLSVVTAQQCSPSTCPDGPVIALFYGNDCSGEPTFYPFTNDAYDTCLGSMGSTPAFRSFNLSANGLEEYSGGSVTCSTTDPNVNFNTKWHSFYVCRPTVGRAREEKARFGSQILLPNVNATYVAPQTLTSNSSFPDLQIIQREEDCATVDSCNRPYSTVDFWYSFTDTQCNPSSSSALYNVSFDRTCYRHSNSLFYSTYECASEHVRITSYFVGNGCEHLYQVETEQYVCTSTSFTVFHCRATPLAPVPYANPFEPVTPVEPVDSTSPVATSPGSPSSTPTASAPTSTSSTLVPSILFLFAIILAAC